MPPPSYGLPAIRAANSAPRSPAKTRWVWESTKPGISGPPAEVDLPVGGRRRAAGPDPGDPAVLDDHGGVGRRTRAGRRVLVAGDELADPGDQGAAHALRSSSRPAPRGQQRRRRHPSRCTPSLDHDRRPPTTPSGRRPRWRRRGSGRVGARRCGRCGATTTRSAGAPTAIGRRRPSPGAAWPAAPAAVTSSAGVKRPRCRLGSRSCSSSPRISSNGSITACWSLPRQSGLPASASARAGPMPSARSRSVVGQKQTPVPVPPEQGDVVAGQVGGVHRGGGRPEQPVAGQQPGRGAAVERLQAAFSAGCSLRWTCSGPAGRSVASLAEVGSLGTARTEWTAAPTRTLSDAGRRQRRADPVRPGRRRAVGEPLLDRIERQWPSAVRPPAR